MLEDDVLGALGEYRLPDAADEREPVWEAVATRPTRRVVAAVDAETRGNLDPSVRAEGDERVAALAAEDRRDRSLELALRLRLRARIGVVSVRRDEDCVGFGAVDPVAVGIDETEVGRVGRSRVDRGVAWRTVARIRSAVAVGIGGSRWGGRAPVWLRAREKLRQCLVPGQVLDRLRARTPVANRRRGVGVGPRLLDEENEERLPCRVPHRADPVARDRERIPSVPVGRMANAFGVAQPYPVCARVVVDIQHRRRDDPRLLVRRSRRRHDNDSGNR